MNDSSHRQWMPVILISAGFLLLCILSILLIHSSLKKDTDSIILSYHQEQGDSISAGSIPTIFPSPSARLVSFTILIPHTRLLQTRYEISLLIPPSDHASIPGLLQSSKSTGDAPDTLRIAIDRNYFQNTNGRYLLILNEFLLEESHGKQPSILFYPFIVSFQK